MKKRILLFTAIAGVTYFTMSSNSTGGGIGLGVDGGKATGTTVNTCGRTGCHPNATTTTVTLELDSAGTTPVTRYVAGKSYTVKITGTNTGTASLTKFGFQLTVVKLVGAGTTTAANAGTFGTLPARTQLTPKATSGLSFDLVEQSTPQAPATGTGGSGTTYVVSIPWTPPASGTGSVKIYGCINAVNMDANFTGDAYNSATPVTITELIPATPSSVSSVALDVAVKAFPNPATNNLNLQLDNAQAGNYSVQVYNLYGKVVATENISVNSSSQTISMNTNNWVAGTYMVSVEKDGARKVVVVVKQ